MRARCLHSSCRVLLSLSPFHCQDRKNKEIKTLSIYNDNNKNFKIIHAASFSCNVEEGPASNLSGSGAAPPTIKKTGLIVKCL